MAASSILPNSNRDQNLFCLKYLLYSLQSFNQRNMTFPCSSQVINMQLIGNWNTPISCLQSLRFPTVKSLSEHLMLCLQPAVPPKHGERGDPPAFWWGEGWRGSENLCKVCSGNQPCSRFGGCDKPGWRWMGGGATAPPTIYISPAQELGFWDCWFCFYRSTYECGSAQLSRSRLTDLQRLRVCPVQDQQQGAGFRTSLAPMELGSQQGFSGAGALLGQPSAHWMGYSRAALVLQWPTGQVSMCFLKF